MEKHRIVERFVAKGLLSQEHILLWRELGDLLSVLDAIGRDGANAMIKVDGSRTNGEIYTVVVSGPRLGERFFRKDGSNLLGLILDALDFYDQFLDDEEMLANKQSVQEQ